jgi:hypothetical protein
VSRTFSLHPGLSLLTGPNFCPLRAPFASVLDNPTRIDETYLNWPIMMDCSPPSFLYNFISDSPLFKLKIAAFRYMDDTFTDRHFQFLNLFSIRFSRRYCYIHLAFRLDLIVFHLRVFPLSQVYANSSLFSSSSDPCSTLTAIYGARLSMGSIILS